MTPLVVVGAGRFALEAARFVEDRCRADARPRAIAGFIALAGEEPAMPDPATRPTAFDEAMAAGAEFVLAVSDPDLRSTWLGGLDDDQRARFINLIHPSSTVADGAVGGVGTIVGPHSHVGINARIGSFSVLNYLLSIGHHSDVGEDNFFSPGFHCGNGAKIGDGNFFGLNCTVGPGVRVGNRNRVQAGSLLLDPVGDGMTCIPTQRTKLIPRREI